MLRMSFLKYEIKIRRKPAYCLSSTASLILILQSVSCICCVFPQFCSQLGSNLDCWRPRVWWNESGCLHCRRLIVMHDWCAGALSCWETKNSPEMRFHAWEAAAAQSAAITAVCTINLHSNTDNVFSNRDMLINTVCGLLKTECVW